MIDEKATYKKFGYHSYDLKPQSHKKVVAICDDCGKARIPEKKHYHALCISCAEKGERHHFFGKKCDKHPTWKGGMIMQTCKQCGIVFPAQPCKIKRGGGKFCSPQCQTKWYSGEKHPNWQGGISFEPYCEKFNYAFKEYIRAKFGRVCFLCPKTEEENGQRLSVHHVNYDKECLCNDNLTCQFVPLCVSCNSKANKNRRVWEAKVRTKMQNKLNGWYI